MQAQIDAGAFMAHTDEGRLVEAARAGDPDAFGRLFDTWFDRVHDLSRRIVKDPGTAGEVAQDAFLTAWTRLDGLEDPDAFGGWLLRIARNASLNRLAKERRSVALDHDTMTTITDLDAPDHDPLAAMDQAARVELVWDAAAALGDRDRSLLDLHLRHGLGAADLAEELGTTANNAHQMLHTLRKRLGTSVRALVLWRAGRPACDDLRRALAASGVAGFDKQAVKVIDRHAGACATCGREREDRLAPAALFGAAPVVAAPILLKAEAASALAAAGVPMSGSTHLGAGTAGASGPGAGTGSNSGSDAGSDAEPPVGPDTASGGGAGGGSARPRHRARRTAALAVAAVVVVVLVAVVGSARLDDGHLDDAQEVAATGDGTPDPSSASGGSATSLSPDATTAPTIPRSGDDRGDDFVVDADPGDPEGEPGAGTAPGPSVPGGGAAPAPPTTRPPSPPTTTPPAPAPPTTAPPTTAPPTTAPPAPAPPEIVRFTATNRGDQCQGGLLYRVSWATENATGVTVGVAGGQRHDGPPSGSIEVCTAEERPRFLLVVVGPDGTAQQEVVGSRIG
jgi:RNA polymerase sigma factor (sigma-70 family)